MILTPAISGCRFWDDSNLISPIVYLGWDENDQIQIYRLSSNEEPKQITATQAGVFDFAVAPDGKSIIYSTEVVNGTSSLWQIDENGRSPRLLLTCLREQCGQPVWAPDNRRLIYERRPIEDDGTTGSPYLWWLDVETLETEAGLKDSAARGTGARFSPDGQWLSYFSPEEGGAIIYNLQDDRSHFVPDEIGVPVEWSPTGTQIAVPNLNLVIIHGDEGDDHLQHTHDYETAVHLFVMDAENGEPQNISGDLKVEDSVPAWSPSAEWIAFGRRFAGTAAGRQLWLVRPDGREAHALIDDPSSNFGPPAWSADGRYLLFQRFDIEAEESDPEVWLFDVKTGQARKLASSGMQPAWLAGNSRDN